jgi:hypothetical protein
MGLIKKKIFLLYKFSYFKLILSRLLFIIILFYNYREIKKKNSKILVLSSYRFRDTKDFKLLNKFSFIIIPTKIQYFLFSKYGPFLSKNKIIFFKNNKKINHKVEEINIFFDQVMSFFLKKLNIRAVISSGAYYIQDAIFFSFFKKKKIKIIIIQRENFGPQKNQAKKVKMFFLNFEPSLADLIITQNNFTYKMMSKLNFYKNSKVVACGTLRMDSYINNLKIKKNYDQKKHITFFSFTKNVGINLQDNNKILSANTNIGLLNFFKNTHNFAIKYAKDNPNIDLVIKHKFGGIFLNEIECNWKKYSGENLPLNCKLTSTDDPHELILKSDLVIAFNSTTIFEAGIIKIPIIIPCFDEVIKEYKNYFNFKELNNSYFVVDKSEYIKTIDQALKSFQINKKVTHKRLHLFNKYVSSIEANAAQKFTYEIGKILN